MGIRSQRHKNVGRCCVFLNIYGLFTALCAYRVKPLVSLSEWYSASCLRLSERSYLPFSSSHFRLACTLLDFFFSSSVYIFYLTATYSCTVVYTLFFPTLSTFYLTTMYSCIFSGGEVGVVVCFIGMNV